MKKIIFIIMLVAYLLNADTNQNKLQDIDKEKSKKSSQTQEVEVAKIKQRLLVLPFIISYTNISDNLFIEKQEKINKKIEKSKNIKEKNKIQTPLTEKISPADYTNLLIISQGLRQHIIAEVSKTENFNLKRLKKFKAQLSSIDKGNFAQVVKFANDNDIEALINVVIAPNQINLYLIDTIKNKYVLSEFIKNYNNYFDLITRVDNFIEKLPRKFPMKDPNIIFNERKVIKKILVAQTLSKFSAVIYSGLGSVTAQSIVVGNINKSIFKTGVMIMPYFGGMIRIKPIEFFTGFEFSPFHINSKEVNIRFYAIDLSVLFYGPKRLMKAGFGINYIYQDIERATDGNILVSENTYIDVYEQNTGENYFDNFNTQSAYVMGAVSLAPGNKFSFTAKLGFDSILLVRFFKALGLKSDSSDSILDLMGEKYYPILLLKLALEIRIYKNIWFYMASSLSYIIDRTAQDKINLISDINYIDMPDKLLAITPAIHFGVATKFNWGKR